ncbi:MAG TPA: S8/S53 family peptidase, partial [Chloroflexota bacterium]
RDQRWVDSHRGEVDRALQLLQVGLHELASYLSLNNCLVVAAVGNDSLAAVERQRPRMDARLPARFETVLGVAATTGDPSQAAPYSNLGDAQELGDHVATFGGGVGPGLQPDDGVIGVYSGEFPLERPNETGWAFWSGTSFATAIVSGIASNLWARQRQERPDAHAAEILAEVHALAREHGAYVADLRTPSIRVTGRWS